MKSFDGYLKLKFGNNYILLAGGGNKLLTDLFTQFERLTSTNNLQITVGGTQKTVTLGSRAWDDTAYLPLSGGTLTGALTVRQYIFGYNYNHAGSNAPAFIFDKLGENFTGIGAHASNDTIWFGAATVANGEASWVDSYKLNWVFNGTVTADRFYGPLTGNVTGNADTATSATNLANKPAFLISENTIAVKAGEKTSDYITVPFATNATYSTYADKLRYRDFITTLQGIDDFMLDDTTFRVCKVSSMSGISGDWNNNDGIIVALPWSNSWGHQLFFDDSSYLIAHRYISSGTFQPWKALIDTNNYTTYCATAGHNHDSAYVKREGDSVSGHYQFTGRVFGYNYGNQGPNAAAFMWDKPGSYLTGMGSNGVSNQIHFGPCNGEGTWISGFSQQWEFQGNIYATNYYTISDCSKKQNITPLSEHIRKFQLKDTEKWHYGVIAQEVPEMFRDGEEGSMTVNYNSILSYYIGSLENSVAGLEDAKRELENKINQLELKIKYLENK